MNGLAGLLERIDRKLAEVEAQMAPLQARKQELHALRGLAAEVAAEVPVAPAANGRAAQPEAPANGWAAQRLRVAAHLKANGPTAINALAKLLGIHASSQFYDQVRKDPWFERDEGTGKTTLSSAGHRAAVGESPAARK